MKKTQREKRYRSYLLIILGTGIMSLAINSIYDAIANGDRRIFRSGHCDKKSESGLDRGRNSSLDHQYGIEYSAVFAGNLDKGLGIYQKNLCLAHCAFPFGFI